MYRRRDHAWMSPMLASLLVACGGPRVTETSDATGSTSPGSMSSSGAASVDETGVPGPTERAVDIVFVIDDTGSMWDEQASLIEAIGALVAPLDAASPPVDYRIAVTTTDNGNPWCDPARAEQGRFVSSSCLERPEDFELPGLVDPSAFPCSPQTCPFDSLDLPDPWIDVSHTTGTTNVPGDQVLDALRCLLPQGIAGCGFEQPLESLHLALERAQTEGEASFGFLRPGAQLAVLVFTDEVDCSVQPAYESIFSADGDRVFWSNPEDMAPTSAVCWNAGVACTGRGEVYDECHAVDLDASGAPVQGDPQQDAVLHPVSRYVDALVEQGAYMVAIHGVSTEGSVVYADTRDAQFQSDFGIGPGCATMMGEVVPPVRVREVIEAVSGSDALHSICAEDYGPALTAFADGILARLP